MLPVECVFGSRGNKVAKQLILLIPTFSSHLQPLVYVLNLGFACAHIIKKIR